MFVDYAVHVKHGTCVCSPGVHPCILRSGLWVFPACAGLDLRVRSGTCLQNLLALVNIWYSPMQTAWLPLGEPCVCGLRLACAVWYLDLELEALMINTTLRGRKCVVSEGDSGFAVNRFADIPPRSNKREKQKQSHM